MIRAQTIAVKALILASIAAPAFSQTAVTDQSNAYEGLYRPADPLGASWSCNPDSVGMDGGALAVLDGYFEGVENRCELTNPKVIDEGGTSFTALCYGESTLYVEQVTLRLNQNGLSILIGDDVVELARCASEAAQSGSLGTSVINEPWTEVFAQGTTEISTTDAGGNSITFTCNGGYDGGLYIKLAGEPVLGGQVEVEVDGKSFALPIWAEGGAANTECTACADTYEALWVATAKGTMMTVKSGGGTTASFSLQGAGDLLGDTACFAVGNSW